MDTSTRITQRDLARRLGLSQVTVSRALAKSALVSPATAQRVLAEAQRLGYRPDPALASLNAWRQMRRPGRRGGTLAWITPVEQEPGAPWLSGAFKRAEALGYQLDVFAQNTPRLTMPRLAAILRSRGVPGIVIAPQTAPGARLDLDLSFFSAVTIGYSLEAPVIDRVITDHHHNAITAFQKLYAAGYRRIALITSPETEARIEGRRIGAYKYMLEQYPDAAADIPFFQTSFTAPPDAAAFATWFEKWQPDALLVYQPSLIKLCEELKVAIPSQLALVSLALTPDWHKTRHWAGVDEQTEASGALAIDVLVARIHANQRGLPTDRRIHLIEGKWQAGETMRRPIDVDR